MKICSRCASSKTKEKQMGKHLGLYCADCDAWIKWIAQKWDIDRAEKFIMPFGKHKDKTMGLIRNLDKDYLVWVCRSFEPDSPVRLAAEVLL